MNILKTGFPAIDVDCGHHPDVVSRIPYNGVYALLPPRSTPSYSLFFLLFSLGGFVLTASVASAQRTPGSFNLGAQAGQPFGVTGKLYGTGHTAYTGLLTYEGDEVVSLSLHRLRERPLPDSLVHLYVGPGLLVGARRRNAPGLAFGISFQAGLNFYVEQFEVFLHVTPALRFFPKVDPTLGRSVGLRYTF